MKKYVIGFSLLMPFLSTAQPRHVHHHAFFRPDSPLLPSGLLSEVRVLLTK